MKEHKTIAGGGKMVTANGKRRRREIIDFSNAPAFVFAG